MAKKKKSNFTKYIPFVVLLLGVAAFCMLFLNVLKTGEGDSIEYTKGVDAVFGVKTTILNQTLEFKFSILGFLAFVLPVLGGIFAIVPVSKKNKNLKFLCCAVLFILSAVFAFIMPSYTIGYYDTFLGSGTFDVGFSLAIGAILCGVFSSINTIACFAAIVLK